MSELRGTYADRGGLTDAEKRRRAARLYNARKRVSHSVGPDGVVLCWWARSRRVGRFPLGPFRSQEAAVKAALEEPDRVW